MKIKLIILVIFIFTINIYGQKFEKGTIITKHYDTIVDVQIEKMSDTKSLKHLTYLNEEGETVKPSIETIKCYTRGADNFTRIYYDCDMILVKVIEKGAKVNLYERSHDGVSSYYIEKVYDELIKVPSTKGKFSKVISAFLNHNQEVSNNVKSKKLTDIKEIVDLYNKG